MTDILGLAQYVQQAGAAGKEAGQKSRLAKLYSQALAAPEDQRDSYLPQMAAEDPAAAMQAEGQFSGMRKDAYDDLGREAGMFVSLAQSGDEPTTQAAYQRLAQKAQAAGHPVPPQYDPKMLPMIEKLAGVAGNTASGVQSTYIDNQGQRVAVMRDGSMRVLGANAPNNQIIDTGNGFVGVNKGNLQAAPVMMGGAPPQQAPQAAPGEVPFTIDPSLPPDVQASIRANPQAGSADGISALPQVPQGEQLRSAPKQMSPAEQARLGIEQQRLRLAENADRRAASAASATSGSGGSVLGDTTKTGDQYLSTLPQQAAAQVKALADGRMAFPTGTALKSPYWQGMLSAVSQYDPNFDAVNYNARAKTRSDFTSGKSANNIKALNTLAGHIAGLQVAVNKLGGTDYPMVNSVRNAALSATGDTRLSTLNAAKTAVANELTTVFRGSGGAEADVQEWMKQLDEAKSPGQLNASIKEIGGLVKSRIEALQEQYTQGMGTTKAGRAFVTPKNQRFFDDLLGGQAPQQSGGWSATRVK